MAQLANQSLPWIERLRGSGGRWSFVSEVNPSIWSLAFLKLEICLSQGHRLRYNEGSFVF